MTIVKNSIIWVLALRAFRSIGHVVDFVFIALNFFPQGYLLLLFDHQVLLVPGYYIVTDDLPQDLRLNSLRYALVVRIEFKGFSIKILL